jgi:hypothetical protein
MDRFPQEPPVTVHYVSEIVEAEYSDWRAFLYGLPDTYASWRWFHSHDLVQAGLNGSEVVPVKIRPDEFLSHCRSKGITPDMQSFRNFGSIKSESN